MGGGVAGQWEVLLLTQGYVCIKATRVPGDKKKTLPILKVI